MAGGSGTRFWPASRRTRPKQFLPLAHGKTLIQATVERAQHCVGTDRTWIITNPVQAEGLPGLLDDFPSTQVIVEPEPRDTAPCISLAAATIEARDPGATIAVMPADHLIEPVEQFNTALQTADSLARAGDALVTFGIKPHYAATSFGYIELGNEHSDAPDAYEVLRFREKPDQNTADTFYESESFLWNSGIFVLNYASLTRAMGIANRDLLESTEAILEAIKKDDIGGVEDAFRSAPPTSIDYAVMEKTDRVLVLRAGFSWNDLGSFAALDVLVDKDPAKNVILNLEGPDAVVHDSENCTIYSEGKHTVALFGVRDLVVVNTGDAVLVCPRDRADNLKELIQGLRRAGREDLL